MLGAQGGRLGEAERGDFYTATLELHQSLSGRCLRCLAVRCLQSNNHDPDSQQGPVRAGRSGWWAKIPPLALRASLKII